MTSKEFKIDEIQIDKLLKKGANRWQKFDRDRIYLSSIGERLIGLEYTKYNTGNIHSAKINGEKISNSACGRIIQNLDESYIDLVKNTLVLPYTDKDNLMEALEEAIKAL